MKNSSLLLVIAMTCRSAFANDAPNNQPPQIVQAVVLQPEALTACSGLSEKDSCQFHNKNNSLLTGTCKILPHGKDSFELGCQPDSPSAHKENSSDVISQNKSGEGRQHKHRHNQ